MVPKVCNKIIIFIGFTLFYLLYFILIYTFLFVLRRNLRVIFMKEKCIMPPSKYYQTYRFPTSERHEVFEGRTGNRDKSIEDGLVIFLTESQHRTGKYSVHKNPKYWKEVIKIQEIAEKAWCDYYGKTKEDFLKRYGRNYLD